MQQRAKRKVWSLYTPFGGRKYLNAAERRRFAKAAARACMEVRLFCRTLLLTGARISEILALTAASLDLEVGAVTIRTLKRRQPGVVRQVPLPRSHVVALNRFFNIRSRQRDPFDAATRLWSWSRTTAWRRVKEVMARAGVTATAAMPKGLRHAYGANATANNVPKHVLQRLLGHASPESTDIYCDLSGPEERSVVSRMWRGL